jgi:hypothetical protein
MLQVTVVGAKRTNQILMAVRQIVTRSVLVRRLGGTGRSGAASAILNNKPDTQCGADPPRGVSVRKIKRLGQTIKTIIGTKQMKTNRILIPLSAITAAFGAAVMIAQAAVDCGQSHPDGCEHKTTQGTQACASGAVTCEGAGSSGCAGTTAKAVTQFPKIVSDGSQNVTCGSANVDQWTGHHYISNTTTNCSQTNSCVWQTMPSPQCVPDAESYSGWSQTDKPASNDCATIP